MSNFSSRNKRRFKEIVRGTVRKDLRKLISNKELIGRPTKNGKVAIPIPHINIPKFEHGKRNKEVGDAEDDGFEEGAAPGGIGQGPGPIGTPIAPGEGEGEGGPKAGEGKGDHAVEEISLDELAKILQEELRLPNIKPKGKKRIHQEFEKYSGLRRTGPDALLRYKPSYFEALKRTIALEEYDEHDPIIILDHDDKRYRSWKTTTVPESDAVLIYMMDVSGSMSQRHKDIARMASYWMDIFLRSQYKGIESVYLIHDYSAEEVDFHTFYHTTTSGGTRIASAYELANTIIKDRYPPSEWNIYLFHYSDGDNWGDSTDEVKLLKNELLPKANLFCYGQIDLPWSWWGSGAEFDHEGEFLGVLQHSKLMIDPYDKMVLAKITKEEEIYDAIKVFLSKGK